MIPTDIVKVIQMYVEDMQLLELTPEPNHCGSVYPLNFDIIFGSTSLAELLVANILQAVLDSEPTNLITLFVNSKLAEVIDFPLKVINDYELAVNLWYRRCDIYNLPHSSPPSWSSTLPFLVHEFIILFDLELLFYRLESWLGNASEVTVKPNDPFLILHSLH